MNFRTATVALLLFLQGVAWSQESPEIVLQKGHTSAVLAVSQIRSTDLLASVSQDGSVNIWDLQSRSIVRTYYNEDSKGEVVGYASATFAPDGSWMAAIDRTGTIRRISLPGGELQSEFQAPKRPSLATVPQNPLLATDGSSIFYSPSERISADGLFKFNLEGEPKGKLDNSVGTNWWSVGVGKLVVCDFDNLSVYSTETLDLVARSEVGGMAVAGVAFNSGGNKLAVSTLSGLKILDPETLEELADLPFAVDNAQNSTRVRPIWAGENLYAFAYANATKGQKLYRADFATSTTVVSDAEATALVGTSRTDGRLCLGGLGLNCFLVDPISGNKLSLEGDGGGFTSFALSPSGDLFTGGRQGDVKHWSGKTGQLLRTFPGLRFVTKLEIAPDGNHLVAGDVLGQTICWEIESGKKVGSIEGRQRYTSHDETAVTVLSFLDNDRFFRKAEKEPVQLHSLSGEVLDSWKLNGEPVAVDTVGQRLAAGSVQEVSLQDKRKSILDQRFDSAASALLYDSGRLLVGTESGSLYRWDYSDPEKKPELLTKIEGGQAVRAITADSASNLTLFSSGSTYGELVEVSRLGKVQRRVRFEGKGLRDLSLTGGGRVLARGANYTLQFYDRESGKKLGSLVGVRDNEGWVALESDGNFDGNSIGLQSVSFELGGQVYKVDQFLEDYLQPGALARLLGDTEVAKPRTPQLTASTLKKPPKVSIQSPRSGETIEGESVIVELRVSDLGGGIGRMTFSHNGHRLPESEIRRVGEGQYQVSVSPVRGVNDFSATAFEAGNTVESRTERCRVTAPNVEDRPPKLHLLSIGIDEYKSGLALKLATLDSESISNQFSSGLYVPGERLHLTNAEATLAGIRKAVTQIEQRAEPQDAFVLYLAGHGTVVEDTYYFLPHDANIGSDESLM
ncbi:MAG: caspase family protein, partial [Candidatus Eremiobacteraeota bacterium]|nr:caspase family protein [Candidatus Eremiobacteraeota bacterium]